MSDRWMIVTDPSGQECDEGDGPILVGAEIQFTCSSCKTDHHLHSRCLSEEGVDLLGGPVAFQSIVRSVIALQN